MIYLPIKTLLMFLNEKKKELYLTISHAFSYICFNAKKIIPFYRVSHSFILLIPLSNNLLHWLFLNICGTFYSMNDARCITDNQFKTIYLHILDSQQFFFALSTEFFQICSKTSIATLTQPKIKFKFSMSIKIFPLDDKRSKKRWWENIDITPYNA